MAINRDFGPWLKERREEAGFSASAMARKLDMAWSHYYAMEKGEVGPPTEYPRLRDIARLLELPKAEVFERADALPEEWLELALDALRDRSRPEQGEGHAKGTATSHPAD